MNDGINVKDYGAVNDVANVIASKAGQMEDVFSGIINVINSLDGSEWNSDSSNAFKEKIKPILNNLGTLVGEMRNASYSLNTVLENYEEVDQASISSVDNI